MLAPVDRVEVTVVIDNFLDVLMAGEEDVARYQARDFGAEFGSKPDFECIRRRVGPGPAAKSAGAAAR